MKNNEPFNVTNKNFCQIVKWNKIALGFQLSINAGRKGALFLLSKIEIAAC